MHDCIALNEFEHNILLYTCYELLGIWLWYVFHIGENPIDIN